MPCLFLCATSTHWDSSSVMGGGRARTRAAGDLHGHRRGALRESGNPVPARRQVEHEPARPVHRDRVRRRRDDDERAHLGMDVAEDAVGGGLRERARSRLASAVQPEVEGLHAREREDVVKDEVVVRERHGRSDRHDQHAGVKRLAFLREREAARPPGHGRVDPLRVDDRRRRGHARPADRAHLARDRPRFGQRGQDAKQRDASHPRDEAKPRTSSPRAPPPGGSASLRRALRTGRGAPSRHDGCFARQPLRAWWTATDTRETR